MPAVLELLENGKHKELWEKCCGFIDLNIEQFMTIQKRLLMEQIELLSQCELGNKIMHGIKPRSVEEFRQKVPVTSYADYASYLLIQREDVLPEKPLVWQHTSGRSGEYSYKWVPVTERMYRELGDAFMALLLFASSKERGEVVFNKGDKFLYGLAPPPYASGCWAHRVDDEKIFDFLPPIDVAENMEFEDRIQEGFKMGLAQGIDVMAAISSMLVAIGDRFGQGGLKQATSMLTKPSLLPRFLGAFLKSKLARRRILPRDIWSLKCLVSTGTDSIVYREKIKETWGRYPLDIYGATESIIIAMQTWDFMDMTFVPNLNFLEFMSEKEYTKWNADKRYQPHTVLLDEVIPDEKYVIIITNFLGGALVRYVIGDIVRITSLRNERLNINIPQMVFYSRADGVLDFTYASFTEKTIWQAIEATGVRYVDWAARKEIDGKPLLHIYLEPKESSVSEAEISAAIDKQLKATRDDYALMVDGFGMNILKVTLLPQGAFQAYMMNRRAAGADLAHLKPPRINPQDDALAILQAPERQTAIKT